MKGPLLLFLLLLGRISTCRRIHLHRFFSKLISVQETAPRTFAHDLKDIRMSDFVNACSTVLFCFSAPNFAAEYDLLQSMSGTSDTPYYFQFTEDLVASPKLVKTHQMELFLKSNKVKGFSVGLTVDPVKINSIKEFSSAPKLAERVISVEKSKEGFIDGSVIATTESTISANDGSSIPIYNLDYKVETTRGLNHFLVRTAIAEKKLYVFTAQCKEESYPTVGPTMQNIIESFRLKP